MASMTPASASRDGDVRMDMDDPPAYVSLQPPAASHDSQLLQTPVRGTRGAGSASVARGNMAASRTSPLPPTTPMTPNRVRARDERLLRRGQIIAGEFSQRRRKKYEFQVLPDSGHRATGSSPRETSPARYSPDQVADAVMSFADFLYFLEEKQREHPLMPTIIARFSELGAVIESQKRHIDLWKSKELDLAISEAQHNFELIRELGLQLEQTDVKLGEEQIQKQMWEEKYQKAVLEAKSITHRAQDQAAHLNAKINELQFQKQDLEDVVKNRNDTIVNMEKDFEELQRAAEKMNKLGTTMTHENRNLTEQCARQEQTLRNLQSQVQQSQQQCEAERKRAEELNNAAHSWEIKYQEEWRLREHLEGELTKTHKEREESASSINRLLGEGGKFRAEFEASAVKHEHEIQSLREKLKVKDSEIAELMHKLQAEADRVRQLNKDMKGLRKQAEDGIIMLKSDMEQNFVERISQLREELGEEGRRARADNEELQQRCQHLQQLSQKKSNQIAELMSAQQDWVGEGNQRLKDLTSAVSEWQTKCEHLQQEIREREKTSAEALRKQGADIQEQFNVHVKEMETYLERKNAEIDQLRIALKAREDELLKLREEAHNEVSKWQTECQELSSCSNTLEFECGALNREVEHRNKALELREKELASLKQQVEAYLAPDNERNKQTELQHRERLRLEEQNRYLQRQLEEMKKDFDAKFDELNTNYRRAAEQESAQRATIVSLHHEKDDLQRALGEISAEKVALEGHLEGMHEEKEVLLESLSQFEKQNGELEEKGKQLLHALNEVENEKTEILLVLENSQGEKSEIEAKLHQLENDLAEYQQIQARSIQDRDLRTQVDALSSKLKRREAEINELHHQTRTYYDSSRSAEEKLAMAEQTLRQSQDELEHAKRRIERSEEQALAAEDKWQQLEKELQQVREWNEQYKEERDAMATQASERNAMEKKCQNLTSELTQTRELGERYKKERDALRAQVGERGTMDTKYQQALSEVTHLREWNERYKKEIDSLKVQAEERERQRRSEAEARESELMRQGRGLEAQYEKVKRELASLQISAEQEVRRLQMSLDNQKAEFQLEHQRLVATNERLERQARGTGEEYSSVNEELTRARDEVAQMTSDLEFHRSVLQQREDQIKHLTREKSQAEAAVEQCQGQLQRVERAFDDFKRQTMRNVKDKKDAIDSLEVENNDLRSQLAHQTELKEQALQFAQGDKSSMTTDLLRKEQHLSEARARLRHLEEQVKSLQRELKNREDTTRSATEQEQRKRVAVEQEREELRSQVAGMQDEIDDLRSKLSTATDQVASLKRELNNHNDETVNARSDLSHVKSELSSRLNSLELELHQAQTTLVTERDKSKKLKETLGQTRQEMQAELAEKAQELEVVAAKLQKVTADAERKERLHAERVEDLHDNETNLIKRLKLVQQRCDATASREAELQKELSELMTRTSEERDQLLNELKQAQVVNELLQGDWSLEEGVRELKNRLVDEQQLVRQHASAIERKDTQIRDLETRVRRMEGRIREDETATAISKQGIEEQLEREMDEMSAKLSQLTVENKRLRDHEQREKVALLENSRAVKSELQARCSRLKDELKQLREENDKLRSEQRSQEDTYAASIVKLKKRVADHTKCEQQIERLVVALEEKEVALDSLAQSEHHHQRSSSKRKETTPTGSSSSSASRRVRELERALQEKEKKILMLNDHLTYLMTSTIELQHENETMLALQHHRLPRDNAP